MNERKRRAYMLYEWKGVSGQVSTMVRGSGSRTLVEIWFSPTLRRSRFLITWNFVSIWRGGVVVLCMSYMVLSIPCPIGIVCEGKPFSFWPSVLSVTRYCQDFSPTCVQRSPRILPLARKYSGTTVEDGHREVSKRDTPKLEVWDPPGREGKGNKNRCRPLP